MNEFVQLPDFANSDSLAGFRLSRLEVFNWGTFHKKVWSFEPSGQNALLTGDIGSGKSTLVDAITTLLVAPQKIAYNKAAGAEARERSLKSYVLGHHKSARGEAGLSAKPVALRDHNDYTVLLATFFNQGYGQHLTLAQVFWIKDSEGQPARLHVVSDERLSIQRDFANFGSDLAALRKRLRKREPRVQLFDSFQQYAAAFRRTLGIENEQAMDLFHQTVSMKSVGNLTDFVRQHMLEAFAVDPRIQALLGHFNDLNRAHEAILKARAQIELLRPIVADAQRHAERMEEVRQLRQSRDALAPYFAWLKADLLRAKCEELSLILLELTQKLALVEERREETEARSAGLKRAISENGGQRLEQLEGQLKQLAERRDDRKKSAAEYERLATLCGMPAARDVSGFSANQQMVIRSEGDCELKRGELSAERTDAEVGFRTLRQKREELQAELESLRRRKSKIPAQMLEVRNKLCAALGVEEDALPFAGELLRVRESERDWEGAVERVLHSFGQSILVREAHYPHVARWVDETHLGSRLVYFRVREGQRSSQPRTKPNSLVRKLEVKTDSGLYDWLEGELAARFDYACCATLEEFRREKQALTRSGQIKGSGERHEKDDRRRVDDRSRYILGWSNLDKIALLEEELGAVEQRAASLATQIASLQQQATELDKMSAALKQLRLFEDFTRIDWKSIATQIHALEQERKHLEAASDVLKVLRAQLATSDQELLELKERENRVRGELGGTREKQAQAAQELKECEQLVASAGEEVRRRFERLSALKLEALSERAITVQSAAAREREMRDWLQSQIDAEGLKVSRLTEKVVAQMQAFNARYPAETREIDPTLAAAHEYSKFLNALESDGLPAFEEKFKQLLNENTIREIANFQSQLNKEREVIRERIDTINRSLKEIDYNEGRYIRLETVLTPDPEVRDFQQQLKACTEGVLFASPDAEYSETKFLEVKRIIERFKGREALTELDRKWTNKVTDVRNWFVFSASELWRETNEEHEHYTDSGGKSGGQKEKLAYTVLAASLAYQFGLEWGATHSRSFRFVVIDEAFGRGSDESARYGLELFRRLNLQLMIVTPLQKIHVIEPYVAAVGFVHNAEGRESMIRNLTIEELRSERAARAQ